ncbi:MAG TPA: 50S ribosomal protein L16 [Planctomycetota bacterium]|nr:50S ribosomal protein L16 [Planctomycetota bacterium]
MMMPKRVKFRKSQRGTMKGPATRGNRVAFGDYGLMSLELGWVPAAQLEAARVCSAHLMGTEGRFYIRVFPHKSVSGKPAEVRMGTGKGEPEYYAAVVKPGTILFEIAGIPEDFARDVFNALSHKMSVRTKMVKRHA